MNFYEFTAARLGVPFKNKRWSWAGLSEDRKQAVFTLWMDHFDKTKPGVLRYPVLYHEENLNGRQGFEELKEIVAHCEAHPGTELLGVEQEADDVNADPRKRKWFNSRYVLPLKLVREGEVLWLVVTGKKEI